MINWNNYFTDLTTKDGILFSKIASNVSYPEYGNENCFQIEENSFWFKHRNNCIAEGVLRYSRDSIFFDIGGGNGFVAKGLENKGIESVLVEPGIKGCLNAQKRNLKNIVCSTLENASIKFNSLPAVGLFDVVEHVENDVEFLTHLHELIIDNGFIFITVPSFKTLWSNEDVEAGHFRRYTRKGMEEKLLRIGFKIEYSTYIFSILVIPIFLLRVIPSIFGLNNRTQEIKKIKNDHTPRLSIIDKVLSVIWKYEINRIRKGKIIGLGGSCFIIARKIKPSRDIT
jgi:hypothetical protein